MSTNTAVINDGSSRTENKKVKFISNILVYEFQIELSPSKDHKDKEQEDFITLKTQDDSYTHKINVGSSSVQKTKVGGWVKLSFPISKGVTKNSKLTMTHDRGDQEQRLIIFENLSYSELTGD